MFMISIIIINISIQERSGKSGDIRVCSGLGNKTHPQKEVEFINIIKGGKVLDNSK